MDEENMPPVNVTDDGPFTGPDPEDDAQVADHPRTDGDIDTQEYYDEGLAGAAEMDEEEMDDDDSVDIPDGFHIE